jgi:aldose 1-epimerase
VSDASTDRYRVNEREQATQRLLILADDDAQSEVVLAPGLGFACIGFRVAAGGEVWPVLTEPPDDDQLLHRTTRYGIPILFPWPNRVRGGRFTFGVTEYRLPVQPEVNNASHGLARERPWQVDATGTEVDGAFCRASVALGDQPDDPWPFRCRLSVEYRLTGRTVSITAEATSSGAVPMPMGFGLHPWFTVPMRPGTARAGHELLVPASQLWELESQLPTGEVQPVETGFDARDWRPLDDVLLDDVYTGLELQDGWFTAQLRDPASGRQIVVRSDSAFREHVVYAPLHIAAVCLEPYSCVTDAFNLAARGLDAGLVVLEPGQTWRGRVVIEARG